MVEIRWHGRGGQGTKTASLLLAQIVFNSGKYVQGFPEYGPERKGAPMTAYNRIDEEEIVIHSNIYNPDIIVIVDPTQVGKDALYGLKENGIVITNSSKDDEKIIGELGLSDDITLYNIDASKISYDNLGAIFPNIPMLTTVLKVLNIFTDSDILKYMKEEITKSFKNKEGLIEGNVSCVEDTIKLFNEKYLNKE